MMRQFPRFFIYNKIISNNFYIFLERKRAIETIVSEDLSTYLIDYYSSMDDRLGCHPGSPVQIDQLKLISDFNKLDPR